MNDSVLSTLSAAILTIACVAPAAAAQEAAPATMKAIRYHEHGGPEVLRLEDAPVPEPKAGEVRIRVHAAAINPVDWKVRQGAFGSRGAELPRIPGYDVAGVIDRVGAGVERSKVGDEVYAFLSLARGGACAEYVVAPEAEVALKPRKLDFVEAAAVPLAALTAWQALFEVAELSQGQTVLIHAGAGGVGHFAVQLARWKGAKVVATASQPNHDFLRALGAEQTIDYRTQRFDELVKGADVVLDSIGGDTLERSLGVLRQDGIVVSIVGEPPKDKATALGVRGARMLVRPDAAQLGELAELIDLGEIVPHVSAVLPLAEARRAHELSQSGRTRGKIVLEIVPRVPRK